ncbi:hypothetical protein B0H15DRAFT_956328 [Mycena belliarum]|uniref:Uncharacterized protein n=1 Tax=Mycena belliarum TaxID=1033014 RepID=A0AAD6TTF3_9AGAR|nr:hypothetical protein B0H15DRAFT_956328 [Mycena belliae]
MPFDIVSGVMREAGRVMADRLLPDSHQRADRRDYSYDDYDRRRSRSPRPYSSSSSGRYSDSSASNGHRDPSPYYTDRGRGNNRPRDHPPYWGPRRRSPSPRRPDNQRYPEYRRGDRRGHRGRGRGRTVQRESSNEEALRRRVVDSRPAGIQTIFPPNIMAATRDNAGHPLFPESELEDGEIAERLAAVREPRDYMANETRRREIAAIDEANGKLYRKVVDVLDAPRVGPWSVATPVVTFVQAVNILRWVHAGDKFTVEFLKSVQTRLGTDPTIHRTQGEVTLLQHQMDAMRHFNAIVEGRKPARSKTTNAGRAGTPFQAPAPGPSIIGGPGIPEPPATPSPGHTKDDEDPEDDDDPMPDTPAANPDKAMPAYLGTSAHGDVDATVVVLTEHGPADAFARHGMRSPLLNAKRWYANIPTLHWPKGMRVSDFELPNTTSAIPLEADVRAWFTINALAPRRGPDATSLHRARFLDATIRLLSVHGTFHRYAQFGGYVLARLPLEHYPFDSVNISFAQIVAWFVQHGIDSQSESVAVLEAFARARRNHTAGISDVNTLDFDAGFPGSLNDVASIVVRDEELWTNIRHGAVRPDETTLYPAHPAGDVEMRPLPGQNPEEDHEQNDEDEEEEQQDEEPEPEREDEQEYVPDEEPDAPGEDED